MWAGISRAGLFQMEGVVPLFLFLGGASIDMERSDVLRLQQKLLSGGERDLSMLCDAFELCRNLDDHDGNKQVRALANYHIRSGGGSRALELYFKTHLFDAVQSFDSYMIYMEKNREQKKQFYLPRRKQLHVVVDAMQDLSERKLELLAVSLPPGVGKALANDTPVLTRNGWKNHGDLVVGDEVIGLDGKYKSVLAVHPKCMVDRAVTFSNGDVIVCHENHEWVAVDRSDPKRSTKVLETKYMERRKMESGGTEHKRGHRYMFQLPQRPIVEGTYKDLPLDPYTLGVWLGDGTNTNPTLCSAKCDIAVIDRVIKNGNEIRWQTIHKTTGVYYFGFGFREALQAFGMCHSRHRRPKHIPVEYLTASLEQRLALLAGLLDTDGTLSGEKYIFSTTETELLDSFLTLVATFGWRTCVVCQPARTSSSGVVGRKDVYVVGFTPDIKIPCVLPRKQNTGNCARRAVSFTSIQRTEPIEGNCITVEGGVYLVGKNLLPTHNSTLALFYLTWLAGKHPEKPILTGSHANSFLAGAYAECLRMMDKEGDYLWHDVFPELSVISTNAKDMLIDIGRDKKDAKRFTTLEFSSIGSGNAGKVRAEQLLYADDLIPDLETALSRDRLDKLWGQYTTDLRQRKIGDCVELMIATRWSVRDPIGRLENYYADNDKARFIVMPALDENDESNFDYPIEAGFTTEFYHQQREIMDDASWKALYMNQPIERGGLLYTEEELRRYFELPDAEPDAVLSVCDTKDRGSDYCVMPVAYQYGQDFYIDDAVCDNGNPELVEAKLVAVCLKHNIHMSRFESNSAGGRVAEKIQNEIKSKGGRTKITTKYTTANKETKILVNAPWVKEHCLFRDPSKTKSDKEYRTFMGMLCAYSLAGKNKHDDVVDAMAMLAEYAQNFTAGKVEVFSRPW